MSYLLYCILPNYDAERPSGLIGVGGEPVSLVSCNGLSAAVSRIDHCNITPPISSLLAYKQVVESIHRSPAVRGVIPMRYGCMVDDKAQIIRLLEKHRSLYTALLKEVEGCVEMGIRVLISDCSPPWPPAHGDLRPGGNADSEKPIPQPETRNPQPATRNPKPETPGQAYLAARKAHYSKQETFSKEMSTVIKRCREAFAGLFVKCKTEQSSIIPDKSGFTLYSNNHQSSIQDPMLSLYFLVQKGAVDPFRKVFRHIHSNGSARLLLSGPWPPYNFVQPEYNDRNKSMIEGIEF